MIVVLLTTMTRSAMTSIVTAAPARNPVPLIMTGVGRTVEPKDGEIAVTPRALDAAGGCELGPDGDRTSQADSPIANANSNTPRWGLVVMDMSLLSSKRKDVFEVCDPGLRFPQ